MKCFKLMLTAALLLGSLPYTAAAATPTKPATEAYEVNILDVCKMDLEAALAGQKDFLPMYGARNQIPVEEFKKIVSVCNVYKQGVMDFIIAMQTRKGPAS